MGFNPAIRRRRGAPTTGAIATCSRARPTGSSASSTEPAQPAAASRTVDALRPGRRARLRLPGREALRRALAAPASRPGSASSPSPRQFASATPAALRGAEAARASPTSSWDHSGDRPPPARPAASPTTGRTAVYSNSDALPRAFVVDRQRTVAGDKAELARGHRAGLRRTRRRDHRTPAAGIRRPPAAGRRRGASARLASYGAEKVVIDAPPPGTKPGRAHRLVLPRAGRRPSTASRPDRARRLRAARGRASDPATTGSSAIPARELADRLDREPGGAARAAGEHLRPSGSDRRRRAATTTPT